jgi:hypothetical protein
MKAILLMLFGAFISWSVPQPAWARAVQAWVAAKLKQWKVP